jgi:hypothetical protein
MKHAKYTYSIDFREKSKEYFYLSYAVAVIEGKLHDNVKSVVIYRDSVPILKMVREKNGNYYWISYE